MKNLKYIFIVLFLSTATITFASTGPGDPGGDPGSGGGDPIGGGAPIGGGTLILMGLVAVYGGRKVYQINKEELEE